LSSGNYEGAYGFIVNFKNILDEQIKTSLDLGINTVNALKDMKADAKSAEKMVNDLKSLMDQKKFPEALSLSEKLMKETNAQQERVTLDKLSDLTDDIEDAKSLGMNIKEMETRLAEAKEAINKRHFKKAYSIITKSKEETNTLANKHKELSEALNSLKFQIEEARKSGIDMSSAVKKMETAKKTLLKQDFDAVTNNIKECENDIKQLTLVHSIKDKINQSKDCMNVAKTLEMDVSDVEMQLKKTVIYLNNGQLEDALGSADKTLDKAKELCTLKISDMLTNGYSMIIEAKKIGLDVLTVEVLYQKAEEALDQERYEKAAKYASQSLGEIEEIRDESQRAANIIHLAGNYIQDAENINADVNDAKKLLEKAFSELKNNEYIASIELGKKCIRGAKKAKEIRVGEVIKSFQSIIDSSKKEGMNVSKAEFLLEEAKIALGDEDYSEALRLAMMSESEVEKVDLQKKMASEIISITVEKLKGAEKIGVGVENIRTLLKNASNALSKKDYVKALEYSMEAGMELSEATEEFERAATTIHAARARINESDEIGVNVKKAKELFETAKKAFNEREYSTAMKFAKETIREAKRAYVTQLSKPIDGCEQLIKTASEIGINIQRANNMLSEAKAALEEESYSQVALFTDNCQRLVEREITKHLI
jgi:DNA-binding IscR family transcriptional regulator